MPNWKHTIDIKETFKKCKNEDYPCYHLAGEIVEKLNKLPKPFKNEQLQEIIENLEEFHKEKNEDVEEFDDIFDELYNWADFYRLWINVF